MLYLSFPYPMSRPYRTCRAITNLSWMALYLFRVLPLDFTYVLERLSAHPGKILQIWHLQQKWLPQQEPPRNSMLGPGLNVPICFSLTWSLEHILELYALRQNINCKSFWISNQRLTLQESNYLWTNQPTNNSQPIINRLIVGVWKMRPVYIWIYSDTYSFKCI